MQLFLALFVSFMENFTEIISNVGFFFFFFLQNIFISFEILLRK